MNKFIKKVVFIFAFAVLFSAPSVFAAPFNTDPKDCATGAIGNATTGAGVPPSWLMDCQNWNLTNVSASAGDTIKVHVYFHNTSSSPATNVTIRLSQSPSSGASNNFNFAGVLSSAQGSIPFNLSTNISTSQTLSVVSATLAKTQADLATPTTVSASQIMSSGINIGTVGTGWANQGDLVVTFRVGSTVVNNCNLTSFTANPSSINAGASSVLSWTSTGCTSVTIPGVGTFGPNGSTTVTPSNTTTYSATGGPSGNTLSTTVSVNSVSACYITSFSASPTYITSGQASTLYWSTTGATNVTISSIGTFGPTGSQTVYPTSTTTYTLTANCINGSTAVQTVVVTVNGNNGTDPSVRTDSPTGVDEDSATLRGYADGNGSLIDAWLEFPCRGTRYDYTYGVSDTNLRYTIYSLSPNTTYYYCAAAQNSYSGRVIRGREVSFTTDGQNNNNNDPDVVTNPATNVGTTYGTINGDVDGNGNYTTTWFRYGTSSGALTMYTNTVSHGSGSGGISANLTNLAPNTTYYFQAVANTTTGGTIYGNIRNFTTNASVIVNSSTSVVTTIATNVSRNNATLNGILLDTSGLSTDVYFEYGTSVNLGARTNSKNLGAGTSLPFNEYIGNLAPNTIYFFRAMANNANGIAKGNIEVFRTPGGGVTPPPVNPPTVDSKIMLKIENRYQFVSVGDTIDYTITYQNISKTKITKPLLQVIVPRYVAYLNSSRGTFAADTNTLNVQVEDLAPGAGGVVYLQGRVLSLPENNADIVTTAYIAYTNGSGAQDSAMAYVLNSPRAGNNLTASAFGAGFFPGSLCGWLLWVVIILLILWALREIFRSRNMRKNYYYNNNVPAQPPRPIGANPEHSDSQGVPHT